MLQDRTVFYHRYFWARVLANDKYCLIVFPDDFTESKWPAGVAKPNGSNYWDKMGDCYDHVYTADEIAKLENEGIVILPYSGFRKGPSDYQDAGAYPYYWTSSERENPNDVNGYVLSRGSSGSPENYKAKFADMRLYQGVSVRLVYEEKSSSR